MISDQRFEFRFLSREVVDGGAMAAQRDGRGGRNDSVQPLRPGPEAAGRGKREGENGAQFRTNGQISVGGGIAGRGRGDAGRGRGRGATNVGVLRPSRT